MSLVHIRAEPGNFATRGGKSWLTRKHKRTRSTPTRTQVSNVLVIGTGAAGIRAAIAAHEVGREVMIVGKLR